MLRNINEDGCYESNESNESLCKVEWIYICRPLVEAPIEANKDGVRPSSKSVVS